jgi:hypothetical protein
VNTDGFGGKKLNKTATVKTNDKKNASQRLAVTGEVKKFVTIEPRKAKLNGIKGETIKSVIRIIPEKEFAFAIKKIKANHGKYFTHRLEEAKKNGKTEYALVIENTKKDAGRYYDSLTLTIDSQIRKELKIRVYGNITEPKSSAKTP